MPDPKTPQSNAEVRGPFAAMLEEVRALAKKRLQAIYVIQKQYVEDSANTLSKFLSGGVDTFKHMQGIWFSTEEFVTAVGRAIFTTTWGKRIDPNEAIEKVSSLSPTLYWRPTKELALLMYASSGRSAGDLWEYIDYAKRHMLSQSLAVIDATNSLSQTIQDLTNFYETFSARDYFGDLQDRAFQVYEERRRQGATYDDELGDWLRAERERLTQPARAGIMINPPSVKSGEDIAAHEEGLLPKK